MGIATAYAPYVDFAINGANENEARSGEALTVVGTIPAGTDASPDDLLDGAPQISGTSVYQRVKAGVSGCTYKLRCTATDSGAGNETYVLTASLGVVTA